MEGIWFLFMVIFVGVLIWLFLFLYDLWSPVMADITPEMEEFINYTANQTLTQEGNDTIAEARTSLSNIRSVWKYWPYVLLLFLLIVLVIATQKIEPMYQSY